MICKKERRIIMKYQRKIEKLLTKLETLVGEKIVDVQFDPFNVVEIGDRAPAGDVIIIFESEKEE